MDTICPLCRGTGRIIRVDLDGRRATETPDSCPLPSCEAGRREKAAVAGLLEAVE